MAIDNYYQDRRAAHAARVAIRNGMPVRRKRIMADEQGSHITVNYKSNGYDITSTYAVSKDSLRRAISWSNEANNIATGANLAQWFANDGCKLDSFEGKPAQVLRKANGSTEEYYYRDGKKHREDGPAVVYRCADGTTESEEFYRDGIKVKQGHISSLTEIPGVTVERPTPKHHEPAGPCQLCP